ncbi:MAG: hypothetical protein LBV04_09170 [Deferribacteraceae bacterium]|nr:hypothetical protein [Deferribacteraceae bacterium]
MIQIFQDLDQPKFKRMIDYYFRYFISTEGKYSIIAGTRDYQQCFDMMQCLLKTFDNEYISKISTNGDVDTVEKNFYGIIADIQLEYIKKLSIIEPANKANIKKQLAEILAQSAVDRISRLHSLIIKLDQTPQDSKEILPITNFFSKLHLFLALIDFYLEFYKSKEPKKHVATFDSFTMEFHMALTHFVYAHQCFLENPSYYINMNIDRAIKHLDRASFDIIKIVISSILLTNPVKELFKELLKIRQNELNDLSGDIALRLNSYLNWLKQAKYKSIQTAIAINDQFVKS